MRRHVHIGALAALLGGLLASSGCRTPEVSSEEPAESPSVASAPKASAPASEAAPAPEPTDSKEAEAEPANPDESEPEPKLAGSWPPLTEQQMVILHGSAEDDVPEHRGGVVPAVENKHYLSGNEKTLDAFHGDLAGVGGGYIGVGTDQGYLFLGWARFEVAWFIDYDPVIQKVHEIYRMLFAHAPTPERFIELWGEPEREEVFALIEAEHTGAEAKQLRFWYRNARGRTHARLLRVKRRLASAGVASYLDDQAQYDFVRTMLEQRRVRALLVNLLDDEGLAAIGDTARALGVSIRVLYLSNAEQYWKRYSDQYRANVEALPFTDDAVVLRTLTAKGANNDYRYNVHPVDNYKKWLARPYVRTVYQVVHAGPEARAGEITHFVTDGDPEESPAARRYRAKHAK